MPGLRAEVPDPSRGEVRIPLYRGWGRGSRMKNHHIRGVLRLIPMHMGRDLCFAFLCLLIAALTVLEPVVLSELIDSATSRLGPIPCNLVMASIVVFLVRIGLSYYKQSSLIRYRNRCVLSLSNQMVAHLLRVKNSCFETWTPSYITSRVIDEPASIDGILPRNLLDGIISAIICAVIFVLMMTQSWLIGLLTVLFAGMDYFVAFRLPLTKVYKKYNETQANLKSQTNNLFQGVTQVKLSGNYEREETAYGAAMEGFLDTFFRKNFLSQIQRLTSNVCKQFGYLLVIVISAVLIAAGQVTLAQFTMLLSLYNLFWGHTTTAENVIPLYKYGQVTCDRIAEVLTLETESGEISGLARVKIRSVEFEDVVFAYKQKQPILNHFTFSAGAGQITSLAGYSGCGKSTALNLLLGFIEPDRGRILLNGQGVTAGNLVELRTKIAYVGQDNFLFNRSIRDNLLYDTDCTAQNEEKLMAYLKLFSLDKLIRSLPGGLDHVFGDNSSTISGGERQRLCLIRELMKEPDVLILDECTAHLDAESERKVLDVIKKLAAHMVVIQVAHKPSALAYSDVVYVVDRGRAVASGRHGDLLQNAPFYQKLLASMKDDG